MARLADEVDALAERTGFSGVVHVETAGQVEIARAYGLADRAHGIANTVVVGLQIPIMVVNGPNVTVPGFFNEGGTRSRSLDYQGIGPLTLHAKGRILRAERNGGFGIAALLLVEFPTGSPSEFVGDNNVVLWPIVALEWRPARILRFGLNVGTRLQLGEGMPIVPAGGRNL